MPSNTITMKATGQFQWGAVQPRQRLLSQLPRGNQLPGHVARGQVVSPIELVGRQHQVGRHNQGPWQGGRHHQVGHNITKVVAISLLDRDGLRPSCELRRASKPVRFPLPLKERIQDCEFPDVYQIIRCSLYTLPEVEQNVKSEVKTKHSDDKSTLHNVQWIANVTARAFPSLTCCCPASSCALINDSHPLF